MCFGASRDLGEPLLGVIDQFAQRPARVGFERVAFEHVAPAPQILVDRFLLFSIRDHRYASIRLRNEELTPQPEIG